MALVVAGLLLSFGVRAAEADDWVVIADDTSLGDLGITTPFELSAANPNRQTVGKFAEGAGQGLGEKWYTFKLHFDVTYPPDVVIDPDAQTVLSASVDGSTAVQIVIERVDGVIRANGVGWVEGSVTNTSAGNTLEMTYENYLGLDTIDGGEAVIEALLEVSERSPGVTARVFPDSGFHVTSASPYALDVAVTGVKVVTADRGASAVIDFEVSNARPFGITAEAIFEPKAGVAPSFDGKATPIAAEATSTASYTMSVPVATDADSLSGTLVVLSKGFNSPGAPVEVYRSVPKSAWSRWMGLAVGAVLLFAGARLWLTPKPSSLELSPPAQAGG